MLMDKLTSKQLKQELDRRGLPTGGNKAELQIRLREAMEKEGLVPDQYEFEDGVMDITKVENDHLGEQSVVEVAATAPQTGFDMGQLMAVMQQMNQTMLQQITAKQEVTMQQIRADQQINQQMMVDQQTKQENMIQQMRADQQAGQQMLVEQIMAKQENALTEQKALINEKIREISTSFDDRIDKLEQKLEEKLEEKLEGRLEQFEAAQDERLRQVEKELMSKLAGGAISRIEGPVSAIKLKPPTFDGSTSFAIFKLQFETAATSNCWSEKDRVAALIVALKGGAADTLQIVPEHERAEYNKVMLALERKYGGDHRRELYRMELKGRFQKSGETLQDFAADVERLVHLAHPGMAPEYTERIKMDTFIDGIRDPETRRSVVLSPKVTFAETIACALTNETAYNIIKPSVKIRRVEIQPPAVQDNDRSPTKYRDGNGKIRCWGCDRMGHLLRDCRESRRKRARTPSPMYRRSNEGRNGLVENKNQSKTEALNSNESA